MVAEGENAVNRIKRGWVFVACLVAIVFGGAGFAAWHSGQLNEWRTLASLRKVDEHPLYVMRYHGDYDFERFLRADGGNVIALEAEPGAASFSCACTCFASLNCDGAMFFGRNFDWMDLNPALLLFTDAPDAYASVSMVDVSYLGLGLNDPSWSDRRRLLYAVHMPFDGMNEHGLTVGMMAVPEAKCRHDAQRQTISGLNAIRLMLDYAKDVKGAVALLSDYNIAFGGPPLHYLIADATGRSAVVEFVDGQMRVLFNDVPWQVSTNFVISEAGSGDDDVRCWRYSSAHEALEDANGCLSREQAMALLEEVSQPGTLWSIAYGISSGDVDIVMSRQYSSVHRFRLWR